jgi:Tfp pilus assembly protein PilF
MRWLLLAGTVALGGCASEPWQKLGAAIDELKLPGTQETQSARGLPALRVGVREYEQGELAASEKHLRTALREGLSGAERIQAHKHLAFIYCSSNREPDCRNQFKEALSIDPALELKPAEAGHPIWDPVFRSVKAASRS